VKAVVRQGGDLTGRVLRADAGEDGGVVLDVQGTERSLSYADLARGLVQVEFSRPGEDPQDEDAEEQP
jgi:ribosome maturation factor RimP